MKRLTRQDFRGPDAKPWRGSIDILLWQGEAEIGCTAPAKPDAGAKLVMFRNADAASLSEALVCIHLREPAGARCLAKSLFSISRRRYVCLHSFAVFSNKAASKVNTPCQSAVAGRYVMLFSAFSFFPNQK